MDAGKACLADAYLDDASFILKRFNLMEKLILSIQDYGSS